MKKHMVIAGLVAGFSAVVCFASMASYFFPGESAHLIALWKGLDPAGAVEYPLMAVFARLLGGENLIAPVCGVVSTLLVFFIAYALVSRSVTHEDLKRRAVELGRVAGLMAAVVFLLTPAVREASSHLEPRLFDATWALALFAVLLLRPEGVLPRLVLPLAMGAMAALGFCDSALFFALSPLVLLGLVAVSLERGERPFLPLTLFAVAFLAVFFVALRVFGLELTPLLRHSATELRGYVGTSGWLFVAVFSTLPFVVSLFSMRSVFLPKAGLVQWIFHLAMTLVSILALATPLAPSSLLETQGVTPVASSAFAALTAGYLAAYWWLRAKEQLGLAAGVVYAFVVVANSVWNLFTFDPDRGAFADEVARKVLADLGERTWFVTDGTLDNHLALVAAREGRELNLVALQRDLDAPYLRALGRIVREKGVGGSKAEELAMSLSLGVLPFVQDWFAADPTIGRQVAIWGAPDLWYSAGRKPVPEFLFFGSDEARRPDWGEWERFKALLEAPKGWGSYRSMVSEDPVSRLRLSLRRHLGFVANNRGVWLQDAKEADAAFALYELVINEIDSDNVCSLFNEIEMAGQKHPKALAKKPELERRLKTIVDDKQRRYAIWRLGNFYGYIRNPDMFVRLGFTWARSGRPGDALAQIRRAIDFVPTEKRAALLNMIAALYAADNDQRRSRKIYEDILAKNADDHDALVGMMRLKLMDGDSKSALAYLERAVKASPAAGRRAQIELAMVAMMKNDLAGAKKILRKVADADVKDLQVWGLLAAVTMQQLDATKDKAEQAKLQKEIEETILPAMERQTTNPYDYYVQTTKAFLLLRKGEAGRREARDAFEAAARARPGSAVAQDLVLGLDISLDDRVNAERHAREVLRRNRNAPLANYVMGSLAIRRAQYREAEAYLRKAADATQPNVLALNDLAEVLRRTDRPGEGEQYIRRALEKAPTFYILHETLAVLLLDQKKNLDEAEASVRKAIELSRTEKGGDGDLRVYMTLARAQILKGDKKGARASLRRVQPALADLTEYEKRELEEIQKGAR